MAKNQVTVDLVGDPEELDAALAISQQNITAYGYKVETINDKIINSFKGLAEIPVKISNQITSKLGQVVDKMVEVGKTIANANQETYQFGVTHKGVIGILENYIKVLGKANEQVKDFNLANQLVGRTVGYTEGALRDYAAYLEKITLYEKTATEGAMQMLLHFRDIRGKEFLDATKAAQDMATALKIDLVQAASIVGNALQNPIEAMGQLEQHNIFFAESEKKTIQKLLEANKVVEAQAIVLKKLQTSFEGAAETAGETFGGTLTKVKNRLITVATAIGEKLLGALGKLFGSVKDGSNLLEAFITKIEALVPAIPALVDAWTPKILALAAVIKDSLVVAVDFLAEKAIQGFLIAQAVYANFGKVVDIVSDSMVLAFTKVKNSMTYVWQEVLPKSLKFAADSFGVLKDQILASFERLIVEFPPIFRAFSDIVIALGHNLANDFVARFSADMLPFNDYLKALGFDLSQFLANNVIASDKTYEEIVEDAKNTYNKLKNTVKATNQLDFSKFPEFPDFADQEVSEEEVAELARIKEEITGLNNSLLGAIGDSGEKSKEVLNNIKNRIQELIGQAQQIADGVKKEPPEMKFNQFARDKRQEALDKEKRDKEAKAARANERRGGMVDLLGVEEAINNLANQPVDENTKAIKENTKTLKELREARRKAFEADKKAKAGPIDREQLVKINAKETRQRNQDLQIAANQRRHAREDAERRGEIAPKEVKANPLAERQKELLEKVKQDRDAAKAASSERMAAFKETQRKQREEANARFKETVTNIKDQREETRLKNKEFIKNNAVKPEGQDVSLKEVADNTWDLLQLMKKKQDEANTLISVGVV